MVIACKAPGQPVSFYFMRATELTMAFSALMIKPIDLPCN
jgi:hypothetical protein